MSAATLPLFDSLPGRTRVVGQAVEESNRKGPGSDAVLERLSEMMFVDAARRYLDDKGFASVNDIVGKSVHRMTDWGNLDLNYDVKARVNEEKCIQCNLCYVACEDGAHQSFEFVESNGKRYPHVIEKECVGCNLCYLICPSPGAIEMVRVDAGGPTQSWRERTSGS